YKRRFVLLNIVGFTYKVKCNSNPVDWNEPNAWAHITYYNIYAHVEGCYYKLRMRRTVTCIVTADDSMLQSDPIVDIQVEPKLPMIYPQYIPRTDLQLFLPCDFFQMPQFHSSVFSWDTVCGSI